MSDEARSMWERFITARENAPLLKRYAKSAQEPAPLFDQIGEDLGSSSEEVRRIAFWALTQAMPGLTSILHERETRAPGWRDIEGRDQQMMNRGSDILSYLHRKLVKEHRLKISDGYGKDPRPYVNKSISNRKRDEERKRRNRDGTLIEVPLDYEAALEIPDPTDALEDSVLENIAYEERKREFLGLRFWRSEEEQDLFISVHVDESPIVEVQKNFGISSEDAVRKRLSRANKNIVAVRDEILTSLLITGLGECVMEGGVPRPKDPEPEWLEEWANRAERSVQPGIWLKGLLADGKNAVAVRSLTRDLHDAPAHIYLVAIKKDHQKEISKVCVPGSWFINGDTYNLGKFTRYIEKVINPTGERQRSNYVISLCKADPNELSGINDALDEVPNDYYAWLISNSYSIPSYVVINI